ncbi:MAG: hypothetical protein DA408_17275 [Bacteroidetes bacterium]|nr:MAG: hypothetical protein C7N36_05235 [Bacteroidota bacterium]PTM09923.1 MAG: hypothetical protein DA408_17275 [Bacteroidota bacterium]
MSWKSTLTLFAICACFAGQLFGQTNCGDTFTDSGGANGNYLNNETMTWTFCPDTPGDLVTLNFTAVSVETCCDDLSVYSGSNTNNPLELDLEAPDVFTSAASDGCLTVTWDSDGSVVLAGWVATVSCAAPPPCPNPTMLLASNATTTGATIAWSQVGGVATWDLEIIPTGTMPTGTPNITAVTANPYLWTGGETGTEYQAFVRGHCGTPGEFTNWVGPVLFRTNPACGDFFYDSGGPNGNYLNNELNTWTFCPDNPGDQVTLNFTAVDVETCCDDLAVYNGTGTTMPLNADLQAPASFTGTTANGCLTVTWDSDGSVVRTGWAALISCNPPPACPNPTLLLVSAPTTVGATLAWTENGGATAWDLEIVPLGSMPTGMPTLVGVMANPYTWTGADSGTTYEFYVRAQCGGGPTSNWVGPRSFTTIPGCGDSFFDPGGPNGQYANNALVTYTFCPDEPGDIVVIEFLMVDVELCCDDLSVYNGTGTGDPIDLDVESPGAFISTAPDGCLTVVFDADGSVQRDGWEAVITCTPCPPVFNQNVSIANIGAVRADVLIETSIVGGSYIIEIDTAGFTPGTGRIITGTGTAVTLTGLTENTDYEFYLTFICPDGQEAPVLGPFNFTTIFANDIGITGIIAPTAECGLGLGEPIRVAISNFGANPQSLFPLNFSVNGVLAGVSQPQDGFFTGIISRDSTEIFEFDANYDFATSGEYIIQVWTEMGTDSNIENDTFTVVLTRFAPPLFEDFESGVLPAYLTAGPGNNVTNLHGNTSFVLGANLFSPFTQFRLDFPVLGAMEATDTLFFDYRYTNWPAGTVATTLQAGDILSVLVSIDCGETYELAFIQAGTAHEPSVDLRTIAVPLGVYEGLNVKIRIQGVHGNGDYWLDLDNVNLPRCNGLGITAQVREVSTPAASDGEISVAPASGVEPFTYLWEDGSMEPLRTGLAPGDYSVTVTDRFGCSDALTVTVDVMVGNTNLPEVIRALQLAPNPTKGWSNLTVDFNESVDARVDIVNLLGQRVGPGYLLENVTRINQPLDLSQVPAGIYLVRIQAAGQATSLKVVKTQ